MREFKGPKYQQGKLGYDTDEKLDTNELARRISRKSTIKKIIVDGQEVLFIYVDLQQWNGSLKQSTQHKIIDNIKQQFAAILPDTKVVVGFIDLEFAGITEKQAFKELVAGTVK